MGPFLQVRVTKDAYDDMSLPESYPDERTPGKSPDANEYFGKWDSRTPTPEGGPMKGDMGMRHPQYET